MSAEPVPPPPLSPPPPVPDAGAANAPVKDPASGGKAMREWLQLALNACAGLAAVYVFLTYEGRNRGLANELAALNTQIATIQRDIGSQTRERNQIELDDLKGHKVDVRKSLLSTPIANGYKLDFEYVLTNTGAKPVEITSAIAEVFLGTFEPGADVTLINQPFEKGAVKWRSVFKRAHVTHEKWAEGAYVESIDPAAHPKEIPATAGGGGTGLLKRTERSQDGIVLHMPARETDMVCVLVTIGIDGEAGRTFGVLDSVSKPLPPEK